MEIKGDTRVFLVINTTEYNNDGKYAAVDAKFSELSGLGFDADEQDAIDRLPIGEVCKDFDCKGVIVIRIA